MKTILKLEELAMFGFSIWLFSTMDHSWWWFPVLILTPDLSMFGYLANNKVGACCYNLAHHKGIALLCIVAGMYIYSPSLELAGIILFGHSSMDRLMGYGLKYEGGFSFTHLGKIGKEA